MQRPTKQTRGANKDEQNFQGWLKGRACCISGQVGVYVHHMYGSAFKHNKQLIGHWACIPLAPRFHTGDRGFHTIGSKAWRDMFCNQSELWEKEYKYYVLDIGRETCPLAVKEAILDWGK